MPPDVTAGGTGGGDGDAWLDGDLVGVGLHGDLGDLAGMSQADLDLLCLAPLDMRHIGFA